MVKLIWCMHGSPRYDLRVKVAESFLSRHFDDAVLRMFLSCSCAHSNAVYCCEGKCGDVEMRQRQD